PNSNRRVGTAAHDLLRQSAAPAVVGVLGDDRGESLNRPGIDDVSSGYSPSPCPSPRCSHPHIEWRTGPERQPTLQRVDLMRAHAQVEQDAIGMEGVNGGNRRRGGERGFEILQAYGA